MERGKRLHNKPSLHVFSGGMTAGLKPSCPDALVPQHKAVKSSARPQVAAPTSRERRVGPETGTGMNALASDGSRFPRLPWVPDPQQKARPSAITPQLLRSPALMATNLKMPTPIPRT